MMQAVADNQPPDSIFRGPSLLAPHITSLLTIFPLLHAAFDWQRLPANAKVVEIGGGMGTSAFPLTAKFPELKLVVQDLPDVIAKAEKVQLPAIP